MSDFANMLRQHEQAHKMKQENALQKKIDKLKKQVLTKLGNPDKIMIKMLEQTLKGGKHLKLMYLSCNPWFGISWTSDLIRQVDVEMIIKTALAKHLGDANFWVSVDAKISYNYPLENTVVGYDVFLGWST